VTRRHVVLVGLPGSGKSTVGREAAALLGAPFIDIDVVLTEQTGMTVADLFAVHGEPAFRKLESTAMARALDAPPQVIAPGGGWIAQPGNLELVGDRGLLVYLAIDARRAAERLDGDVSRPLLVGGDLVPRVTGLLAEREAWYRRAEIEVGAEQDVAAVANAVAAAARRQAGW
jgi:shikimate kinase